MVWKEKHTWKHEDKGFVVEVVGHTPNATGEFQRWNVYLYVYSTHPRFKDCGLDMWSCPVNMPGPSFFKAHIPPKPHHYIVDEKTGVSSYQYGNDYDHLWHEGWDAFRKKSAAFNDAEEIIEAMKPEVALETV